MILRVLAAGLAVVSTWAASAVAAPLEVYGKLPAIEQVSISPDGANLALIATDGENRMIVTRDLATGQFARVLVGDAKVRSLDWADSSRLLITTSITKRVEDLMAPRSEWLMLFAYDLKTRKLHHLLRDAKGAMNVLAGSYSVRKPNGVPTVFAEAIKFDSERRGRTALYRIDPVTGKSKLVHAGFRDTRDWLVGANGEIVAQTAYDSRSGRWSMSMPQGTGWTVVKSGVYPTEPPAMRGLGRTADTTLVSERIEGVQTTRELNAKGEWSEPLLEGDQGLIRDPVGHHLIGHVSLVGDQSHYTFFAPRDQKVWNAIRAAYGKDEGVSVVSWSDDRRKLVVYVDSPVEGPAYGLVDLGAKKATWIGGAYSGVDAGAVATVRPISFKAKDGLELTGYLTTPKGKPAKDLPLVVLPHGGPASRDTLGFDWWSQALASRGYAVLRVNFRGSDGFGWEFLSAGFGQWGRKMQTDLSDGVRHVTGQGVADPKRVCIVGASYGGYAALAGVSLEPDVYRCAASVAGVSDPRTFLFWSKSSHGMAVQRYWRRFMGADDANDPRLVEISPFQQLDRITAPVLLIHGRDDTVVPFEQTRIMADALKKAGKPVELVALQGEDHWLSRGETRLQMLTAMVAFLEKHNPPN